MSFPLTGHTELPDRVRLLRQMRHWDQVILAERSHLSSRTVSQIETGRADVTALQCEALGSALGYSPHFLASELGLGPSTKPWLRAYADASKREADAREASALVAVELIRRLRLRPLPDLIPDFRGSGDDDDAIEEAALELRDLAGIGTGAVVPNAIRAAERLGCVVLPLESELGRHLGMSVRADDIPVICVARDGVPGDRQRFTVCHELGHLMLHGVTPPPRTAEGAQRMEHQAHRFAASFLTPATPLIESLEAAGGRVTLTTLMSLKSEWGVAIKSLVGRFRELGIIDPEQARSLYKQISARKWTKDEPVEVPTESAQWFQRSLLRLSSLSDLRPAVEQLAAKVGANADDLFDFADWADRPSGTVVDLAAFASRR